ncbi:MAG: Abi-alpha family protein [Nocardioides sp.]|uniref:Abi-alpha family protein n=1 Tax=Nocardioides sp. TaxID=35761 RepID=UPI0039E5871B
MTPTIEELPGLARVAAVAAWHAGQWGARAYLRTGLRAARAVVDAEERAELAQDAVDVVGAFSEVARSLAAGTPPTLGELVDLVEHATDREHAGRSRDLGGGGDAPDSEADLRRRGADLLERSRDVWSDESGHPAYARILDELAPDEARILLLLLQGGPQPSVDVRTGGPVGLVSSQLVAPGLSMIGARAGVRYGDRVPAYLNNLFRLGLVWFSKEALRDSEEYQVLEAQPDVLAALHAVKFAKVVRRSVHLTPFGEGFCRATLVEPDVASEEFPQHSSPEPAEATEPPNPSRS